MSDDVEMWKARAVKEAQKVMGLVHDRRLLAEAIVIVSGEMATVGTRAYTLAESILNDEPAPTPADRDALADYDDAHYLGVAVQNYDACKQALAQVWRLLERGADPGMAIEVIANALGVNEPPDSDRDALADALIAWAADDDNVMVDFPEQGGKESYACIFCDYWDTHPPDCLHERAKALEAQ